MELQPATASLKPVGARPSPTADNGQDSNTESTHQPGPTLTSSARVGDRSQSLLGELVLTYCYAETVVGDTRAEEQWAAQGRKGRSEGRRDGRERVGGHTGEVGCGGVVEEVEHSAGGQWCAHNRARWARREGGWLDQGAASRKVWEWPGTDAE